MTCTPDGYLEERTNEFMTEKDIEQALTRKVKAMGGMCIKLTSIGTDGLPDRLVLLLGGHVAFVELKDKGKKPRPLQYAVMNKLKRLGFKCFVVDDKAQIEEVLHVVQTS